MKTMFFVFVFLGIASSAMAQFHQLKMPQPSNFVQETQRIGVTDITITYSSPAVRGRDLWSSTSIIPHHGDPIPWRAGANMNTTIEFSTEVSINGKALKAGKYGFHMIPKGESSELLFAHNHNQWGSYYLDLEKDITLRVEVQDTACAFSEKLDYEFLPVAEDKMVVALEWAEKRIPFTVSVDLNKTVVEGFRADLRGKNVYLWEAWNDAANWCLRHDTNLEEAYTWANRSINGGYNGYAANKNMTNLLTKARIALKLDKQEDYTATVEEAFNVPFTAQESNYLSIFLLRNKAYEKALTFTNKALDRYPDVWFVSLNNIISKYFVGKSKEAIKQAEALTVPEQFTGRFNEIVQEMKDGKYALPQ